MPAVLWMLYFWPFALVKIYFQAQKNTFFSSEPIQGTKCVLTIGDFKVRIRIFLRNALEATISIRHIAYTSVSTDSTSLKLHLKPVRSEKRQFNLILFSGFSENFFHYFYYV